MSNKIPEERKPLISFLKQELEERKWTQAILAREANVPDATISHILHGDRSAGHKLCHRIATALNYPHQHIMELAGIIEIELDEGKYETPLLHYYRQLSSDTQLIVVTMVRGLAEFGT